jgi:hypothetical protein
MTQTQIFVPVELNDHELARYLRDMDAIDCYKHVGNSCRWFSPNGRIVALVFYNNQNCTREIRIPETDIGFIRGVEK